MSMRTILLLAALASAAWAQTVSTQILGLVTDRTGAVLPGATVRARRVATGDVRTTQTNDTGNYVFPLLESGEYEVTCALAGFKTEVRSGVVLQLQDRLRANFQMEVGDQVERVEVTAATGLLHTEDATLGSVVEHKRLIEMPLNGRNFAQVALSMPGVVYGTSRMGVDGGQTIGTRAMPGQIVGLSANGQRDTNQNITLDGVTAVDGFKSAMLFVPSLEAIQEFKIQSAVYSAEYGMNSGAQGNVVIRSGANEFHATVFEFLRNDALDARGFFLPTTQQKNRLRRNQFGGVASGPIKRDRTFWLANFEARRENRGTPALLAVPTLAMRRGDFSEIVQPRNRWYPTEANPASTRAIRGVANGDPLPNNTIPASLISRVSQNLLTYQKTSPFADGGFIAPPNIDEQARAQGSTLNRAGTSDQILNADQALGRFDHRLSDNDRIFARYVIVQSRWTNNPLQRTNQFVTRFRAQNLAVGYTKILTPTILNEARFGVNRVRANQLGLQTETDFTHRDLGLDMRVISDNNRTLTPREEGLPDISMTGFAGAGSGNVTFNVNETYNYSDNITINRGRHNFKGGAEHRRGPVTNESANLPRGQISFTRDIVGIPDAFAAFLIGIPLNANSAEGAPQQIVSQKKWGLYWLDDFKATPKLTLNFGLRWDWYGPVTDPTGRMRNLSFASGEARAINGLFTPMLVPDPLVVKVLYDINWKQFMPRVGLAYRLSNTMVIRAGAGHFYSPQQTNNFNILNLNPPLSGSTVFQNDTRNPTATIGSPFASAAAGAGPAALVMLGNLQARRNQRSMYLNNDIWQWTLEIEKSLGRSFVTGLAYVGSQASNIDMPLFNSNNPDPGLGAVQGRRPLPFYIDSRDAARPLALGTIRRLESWTSANYNALQARAEKRYSNGLLFHASFNYQKALSVGYSVNEGAPYGSNGIQDPNNREGDRGRSAIDQRLRFVFSHVWEIPWMRQEKGWKGFLLGGWNVNGIAALTSGLPVTVSQTGDSHNTGTGGFQRPHIVTGQAVERVMSERSLDRWFNTAAVVRSKCNGCAGEGLYLGPKGYGNAGTSLFDAPAQKNWDFGLSKDFRIREGHRVQFRFESFNFLNTPQFNAPSRGLGNADFGRISSTVGNNREMQFGLKYFF